MKSNAAYSKTKSSSKMVTAHQAVFELKQRIVLSLNKLADRDTCQIGTDELERVAESLTPDMIGPFLSCVTDTDSEQKVAVRKECVRVMSTLAKSQGGILVPHLGKMISCIVKRLKDTDSVVQDACVDTSGVLSRVLSGDGGECGGIAFAALVRPLFEALGEQNRYVQSGAALCLARVIDEARGPPLSPLSEMLARVVKLLKNQHFMAKPALIELIRSIIQARVGIKGRTLSAAVTSILEALKSTDWTTRKAASTALSDIATSGGPSLSFYKNSCILSLESCRFDKVKPVRDSILHSIQCWKAVAGRGSPEPSDAGSSTKEFFSGDYSNATSCGDSGLRDASFRRAGPVSVLSEPKQRAPLGLKKSCTVGVHNHENVKLNDWHIDISIPKSRNMQLAENDSARLSSSCTQNISKRRPANADVKTDYDLMDDKIDSFSVSEPLSAIYETKHITTLRDCLDEGDSLKSNGRDSGSSICETGPECLTSNEHKSSNSTATDFGSQASHVCCQHTANELAFIKQQIEEINIKQSSLLDLLQGLTGNTVDSLSVLQLKVHDMEDTIDKLTGSLNQRLSSSSNSGSNLQKKNLTACSSPRLTTQTPRPSIDATYKKQQQLAPSIREIFDDGLFARGRSNSVKEGFSETRNHIHNKAKNMTNKDVMTNYGELLQKSGGCQQRNANELISASASTDSGRPKIFGNIIELRKRVKEFLNAGDVEEAYIEVLQANYDHYLIELMCRTGPVLDRLSSNIATSVLGIMIANFAQERFRGRLVPWIQQVVDLSVLHGTAYLFYSTKEQMDFLLALQEHATRVNDSVEQRILSQLASKFGQLLDELACRKLRSTPVLQGIRQCV